MCDCIKQIEKKIEENLTELVKNKTRIKSPELNNINSQQALIHKNGKLKSRTFTEVYVYIKGQKKPVTINFTHSFCPFCGKKFQDGLDEII